MSWTFVVLALVLFLFAIYIGFLCGQWACEKRVITKRDYWIANFAGAAAVVLRPGHKSEIGGCAPPRLPVKAPLHAPVAQLDRAPDYESGGRAFESLRVRH